MLLSCGCYGLGMGTCSPLILSHLWHNICWGQGLRASGLGHSQKAVMGCDSRQPDLDRCAGKRTSKERPQEMLSGFPFTGYSSHWIPQRVFTPSQRMKCNSAILWTLCYMAI